MEKQIYFESTDKKINQAFRIALGDLYGNIRLFQDGLLEQEKPVILAGLEYDTPWTRDAAINVWNGAGLLFPEAAKNTLLSVLGKDENGIWIDGQYWDAIIWVTGAWNYYLYTGDQEFLALAYQASVRSLKEFRMREYSEQYQLFSGAACYGDGISAYDDEFSSCNKGESGIGTWWEVNPEKCEKEAKKQGGIGLPMYVLSTNCLYYEAYVLVAQMEEELQRLGKERKEETCDWKQLAEELKGSINKQFWQEEKGEYLYYLSPLRKEEACQAQEALGIAFAILFGIAEGDKAKRILERAYTTKEGIPCVWPSFTRYDEKEHVKCTGEITGECGGAAGETVWKERRSYGRHSGTVWPHAQGFWADAAKRKGDFTTCWNEIKALTNHVWRDQQFGEIYHPDTGELYGGVQECKGSIALWHSCNRQTWSATGYLRMILFDVCGMEFLRDGISFSPATGELEALALRDFYYRGSKVTLEIQGKGHQIKEFLINGEKQEIFFLKAGMAKEVKVEIFMK